MPVSNATIPAAAAFAHIATRLSRVGAANLFFVCGSMKSGTTWLQILLDAHPGISCGGEGHFADRLAIALQNAANDYNRHIEWKNTQEIGGLPGYAGFGEAELAYVMRTSILLLLAGQVGDRQVQAVGEKTPDNILAMPFLHRLFPEAKFVVIVRDGRDCAVSGWFHNRRLSGEWTNDSYPDLDAYAAVTATGWAAEQEAAAAFGRQNPSSCLFVRYEDLLDGAPAQLHRILEFLGVESTPELIAACCAKADFAALANGRPAGQEDAGSFFRKGIAGDWRNHLGVEANAAFIKEAGAWLRLFGYVE